MQELKPSAYSVRHAFGMVSVCSVAVSSFVELLDSCAQLKSARIAKPLSRSWEDASKAGPFFCLPGNQLVFTWSMFLPTSPNM